MTRVLAVFLLLLLAGCGGDEESPEQQIRALIESMELALESGSVTDAAQWIAANYADSYHPNKRAVVRSLFGYTRRHRNIHLFTRIQQIEVEADRSVANAVVQVAMTAQPVDSVERLVALKADLYRFEVDFAWDEAEERWLIGHSRWKRANLAALLP